MCGHVIQRKEHCVGRRAMGMEVQRKRGRLDNVRDDIREKGLSGEEVYDRATWRRIFITL